MKRICMLGVILAALWAAGAKAESIGTMAPSADLFKYDELQPLEPDLEPLAENESQQTFHLAYSSTNGMRPTALYYVPKKAKRPLPCVIFMHGSGGSKDDFKPIYDFLALRGFAVLAVDAHLHGERKSPFGEEGQSDFRRLRNIILQTVVDLRRAVDWLETREEIDPNRIGYAGASQGSLIGGVFAAVETRIAATALLVGGADFHVMLRHSQMPPVLLMRNLMPEDELDRYADELAVVDAQYYVGAISPRPVFMMNGEKDFIISPEAGRRLNELAGEPKEIVWYDGGHIPPIDQALVRMSKFFKENLKRGKRPEKQAEAAEPAGAAEISFNYFRDFSDPDRRFVTVMASASPALPEGGTMAIHFPKITRTNFPLFDDGTHGDRTAGDGTWSFRFELGPVVPDLSVVGGETLYEAEIQALSANGKNLATVNVGVLTGSVK